MVSKNGEIRQCANTNRVSIEKTTTNRAIDMNSVMKSELNFHGIILTPINELPGIWFTASQIGYALQYADDKAVQRIYSRHADEFTEKMTGVVKVTTPYGDQMARAFSLRGAHLIAMFARSDVAKEFRHWVLDILDREVERGNQPEMLEKLYSMQLTGDELCSVAWLYKSATHMRDELELITPTLAALKSPLARSTESLSSTNVVRLLEGVQTVVAREVSKINPGELLNPNWERVLPDLRIH